jgi:hypothetical protein
MLYRSIIMLLAAAFAGVLFATDVPARDNGHAEDRANGRSEARGADRADRPDQGFRANRPHRGRVGVSVFHDSSDDFIGCFPTHRARTITGWRWVCN